MIEGKIEPKVTEPCAHCGNSFMKGVGLMTHMRSCVLKRKDKDKGNSKGEKGKGECKGKGSRVQVEAATSNARMQNYAHG